MVTIRRINTGGAAYTDTQGNLWEADNYFSGGNVYSKTVAIANTVEDPLYQDERWLDKFAYAIPVDNGEYTVNLKFSELFWTEVGQRVFDVNAENQLVIDDLDIFKEAGGINIALDKSFKLKVTDGTLNLDFLASINNAKIDGIEIIPVGTTPTPTPTPTGKTIRINAGGKAYTDSQGNVWSADNYFDIGNTYGITSAIANTGEDPVYQDLRWLKKFSYAIPVENGDYTVKLKFAETYWTAAGKRVFDVSAENQLKIDDLDVFKAAGGNNIAIDQSFNVKVADGTLNLDFLASVNNAIINGIEITPATTPTPTPTPTGKTIRINAGGKAYTDSQGNVWSADNYFDIGNTYGITSAIANTGEDPVYQDLRWLKKFSYAIPVENGDYTVKLKFAETYWTAAGKRVFDVSAENQLKIDDLDVFKAAGGNNIAIDQSFNVKVADGTLNLDFLASVNNAIINGIEITPATTPTPTPTPGAIRINIGGAAYTDTKGNKWDADQAQYLLGNSNIYKTTAEIGKTEDDPIYQDDRYAQNLAYEIPVAAGNYRVNLHFAENFFTDFNDRIFDVSLEGQKVFSDVDIFKQSKNAFFTGNNSALVLSVPTVSVSDGKLNLNLDASVNNALLSGLEIIPLTGPQVILQQTQGRTEVTEGSAGDSYSLVLNTQPTTNVTINVVKGDRLTTDKTSLTFTPANWNVPQTVTVNVVDDKIAQGADNLTISHTISTTDSNYRNLTIPELPVSVNDNDTVAVSFTKKTVASITAPSTAAWGPDGRLYVGTYSGEIRAYTFDENYNVTNTQIITTIQDKAGNKPNILGIAFNPYDQSGSPSIYVAHTRLYGNGGSAFPKTEQSFYSGQVSILDGANFSNLTALVTGLPTSNQDHGINALTFDQKGDLYINVGSNTNAGVINDNIGGLPESPLSAAILKAEISKPGFKGNIKYVLQNPLPPGYEIPAGLTFDPADSQAFGDVANVVPGTDVSVYASGLRNPFGAVFTTKGLLYATDNGHNPDFGELSTSATTSIPAPGAPDELNLIKQGEYYGSANRNRGRTDDRQNVYYGPDQPSIPGVYTAPLTTFASSTNGIDEYRATTFQSQLRGNLIAQQWNQKLYSVALSADGTKVIKNTVINADSPVADGLSVLTGPRGAILGIDYADNSVSVATVDDLYIVDTTAYDIFPWRAPAAGGNTFMIGGKNFGNLGNTEVSIGGQVAKLTAVSSQRISGILPNFTNNQFIDPNKDGLLDVRVNSNGQTSVITDAFAPLNGSAIFV
ncbi:PQQ-dependent sugar dehydrogenase [Calothrix sp. FACHB-156]|nr:PQQ-dependent sugar dehydrogenase [Calothrix sp. FACHB-156]